MSITDIEALQPVWLVGQERCVRCGYADVVVVHHGADFDALDCVHCHRLTSRVTHWLSADHRTWELRLSVLPGRYESESPPADFAPRTP